MPVISVIIPVYNGEKTIHQTIESILSQTFSDFELIIINDGSTDSTLKIISNFKDSRIKIFSYPNAGQPASRNRGVTHALGKYVSFIDADDLWTGDKLESQLKALQANPEAAVAYSWVDYIDEAGVFSRQGSHISRTGNVYANLLLLNFIESGSNPLILKQALIEVGGCDESLTNSHDWDMWLRLAARYHYVVVSKPQILYRVSPNSMSSNVVKHEKAVLQVIGRAFAQAPESIQPLKQISLGNIYKYLLFKALEGVPGRYRGLVAFRLLWSAVGCDRTLLRTKVIWKVLFKIAIVSVFSPQLAQTVLIKVKNLANIHPLLFSIQRELPSKFQPISQSR